MRVPLSLIAIVAVLSTGCGGMSPSGVVESYFSALEKGDAAAMKLTLSRDSAAMLDEAQLKPCAVDRRIIDEKAEGERAVVTVEVKPRPENGRPQSREAIQLPVVVIREDSLWKIDVKATIKEAVAQRAGHAIAWLASAAMGFRQAIEAEGARIGQAFEELGTSVGNALRKAGEGFRRGIRSASEGLKEGLSKDAAGGNER